MRNTFLLFLLLASVNITAQPDSVYLHGIKIPEQELTIILPGGSLGLSDKGVSYFANLSLSCMDSTYPHYYMERYTKAQGLKAPVKLWPSFYNCFDWHSSVHNHWTLIKLLKTYPKLAEAAEIKARLEQSFDPKNILQEVEYLKTHQQDDVEFPYGTSWLLKVSEELIKWNDPLAKKWLKNLQPLTSFIVTKYIKQWPAMNEAVYSGDHYSSALGLSFALDYARTAKNDSLEIICVTAANKFYQPLKNFPLIKEPFAYDFMSSGLLIADLMRKVLPTDEYVQWLHQFAPGIFDVDRAKELFYIKQEKAHDGYKAHWDGFQLNRIWCLNGILKSIPSNAISVDVKNEWIAAQKEMWDYAQKSIGRRNFDIDHWLSTFSVFALEGY